MNTPKDETTEKDVPVDDIDVPTWGQHKDAEISQLGNAAKLLIEVDLPPNDVQVQVCHV